MAKLSLAGNRIECDGAEEKPHATRGSLLENEKYEIPGDGCW